MSRQGLYVPKKAANLFWPNILIILGGSKTSGTHISENHLITSFPMFLVGHSTTIDQKGKYLAQNDQKYQFLAKFLREEAKPIRHLFRVKNIDWWGSNGLLGTKKCNFNPPNFDVWDLMSFFCFETAAFTSFRKVEYGPKIRADSYLGKGHFFLCTTLPDRS